MRRVPPFLLPSIYVTPLADMLSCTVVPCSETLMEFVLFQSPAIIYGLLMTEILEGPHFDGGEQEVNRFFFGYKCSQCQEIFLVPHHVRNENDLYDYLRHKCDPSDLRRAVRNARRMGLEQDSEGYRVKRMGQGIKPSSVEEKMTGPNGRWWVQKTDRYRHEYSARDYSVFTNNYVYSREEVDAMFRRGEISLCTDLHRPHRLT